MKGRSTGCSLFRKRTKSILCINLLLILPLLCSCSVIDFFDKDYLPDEYTRHVQCYPNSSITINDYAKVVTIICNGTMVNVSNLLSCTGLSRIAGVSLVECRLPALDVGSLLGEFKLKAMVYLFVRYPPVQEEEIIVRDLTHLELLGLSINKATKYTLQNLPSLLQVEMPYPDVDTFPDNLLSNLSLLNKVYLAQGRIGSLPETTFLGSTRLRVINLGNNTLKMLPAGLFKGLRLLVSLGLSYNLLGSLPEGIFSDLLSLREIFLIGNLFSQLAPTLFSGQVNLELVALSNNSNLSALPEKLFENTRRLNKVLAGNCALTSIPEKLFSNTPRLSSLSLFNNKIQSLSAKVFENNSALLLLELTGNLLQSLPKGIFRRNYNLQILGLSNNLLSRIPVEAMLNLKSLIQLYLDNNMIASADEPQLETLGYIEILTLNRNNISSFKTTTPFGRLPYLIYLGLSKNNFVSFPILDWSAYGIAKMSLDGNRISHLDLATIPPTIVLLDLTSNQIKSISLPTENSNLENKHLLLNLSSNPIVCDCKLRNFLRNFPQGRFASNNTILILDADLMMCASPPNWRNQSIMQISPLYLLCPVSILCPTNCRCYELQDSMVLVNCSFLGLTNFPTVLPPNTSTVHLEGNLISEFAEVDAEPWATVTHLYLDHNRLVAPKLWSALSVKYLSLRYNRLLELPSDLTEYIGNTPESLLDIRNNSWMCNCTYLPFKLWLTDNIDKLVSPEEISCTRTPSGGDDSVSHPIFKVPDDAFCTSNTSLVTIHVIVGVFASCCLCLVIVILIILRFGNRQTFLAYMYAHIPSVFCFDPSDIDKDKNYDAFLSYTSCDRDSVLTILKELEDKPPNFKFCIHERDWLPGYPIVSQIETSVENSRKTIIFLSPEFLKSFWCEAEFQAAYMKSLEDKVDRLIIIVKGELPEKESIPLDVQTLLSSKTYLVWGERWFWEKLKYVLPHVIRVERSTKQEVEVEGMIQQLRGNNTV